MTRQENITFFKTGKTEILPWQQCAFFKSGAFAKLNILIHSVFYSVLGTGFVYIINNL